MTRKSKKIADMEAYYQELKARIAATHQPVSTVTQEESSEEPLVEENVTSETPEVQVAGEESPVVFESAQTETSSEEVSPVADETETEPLKEADEIDVIKLEEESPSPDAEPVK